MNGNSERIIYRRLLSSPHDGYKKRAYIKSMLKRKIGFMSG